MTGHGPLGGAYTHGHIAPRRPNRVYADDDHALPRSYGEVTPENFWAATAAVVEAPAEA